MRLLLEFFCKISRIYIHRDMDTRIPGMDHISVDLNHLANADRLHKADTAYINRDTVSFCPVPGAGVAGLIDPFHYRPAVNLPAEIHVARLADKLEGDPVIFCHN